jgi:hypothetical protein
MATRKGARIDFLRANGITGSTAANTGVPVVTDTAVNTYNFAGQGALQVTNTADNALLTFTKHATLGWRLPVDIVSANGIEINHDLATIGANGACAFTIGTDPAFYLKWTSNVVTVLNYTVYAVGFRKAAAYALINDATTLGTAYTDSAYLSVDNGDFKTYTTLNNSGEVVTDVTTAGWAADETHSMMLKVSSTGAVTYFVDDVVCPAAVAFTFDTGDIVIPSIVAIADATATASGYIYGQLFECGYQ